jgi:hypothetical protein
MAKIKHNSGYAVKSLRMIAKGTQLAYGCAKIGKKGMCVIITREGIGSARTKMKNSIWDGPPGFAGKGEEPLSTLVGYGFMRLEKNGILIVKRKGLGEDSLNKALKRYFQTAFHKAPVWGKVKSEDLLDEHESEFVPGEDDHPDSLVSEEEYSSISEEFGVDAEEKDDDDDLGYETDPPPAYDAPPAYSKEESPPDYGELPVPAELQAKAQDLLGPAVKNALKVAATAGLLVKPVEAELLAKLTGWLLGILAATPPAERERVLANWICRLQLALSYTENARSIQTVKKANPEPGKPDSAIIDGMVDLADVGTGDVHEEEVARAMYNEALSDATKRDLPAPLWAASFEGSEALKTVEKKWPKEPGKGQVDMIQHIGEVIRPNFPNDPWLTHFLGLKGYKPESEAGQFHSVVWPAIKSWRDAHRVIESQIQDVMDAAEAALREEDPSYSVASLGGTWMFVTEVRLKLNDVDLPAALGGLVTAEDKSGAITAAEAKIKDYDGYIASNDIIRLLDEAPFDGVRATVKNIIEGSLVAATAALRAARQLQSAKATSAA